MRNVVLKILVCTAVVGVAACAFASGGGGGTKATVTIEVRNDAAEPIGVIVDPNLEKLMAVTTQEGFLKMGGKIAAPGAVVKFSVKVGKHTVYAAPADLPIDPDLAGQLQVNVNAKQVLKLKVVLDEAGKAVLSVLP